MKTILMQKYDSKAAAWRDAADRQELGVIVPVAGSPMLMPFALAARLVSGKHTSAICFRYLNDYQSILRTIARVLTDISAIALAKMTNVPVLWVCHNVDKETAEHYPVLSRARRAALARAAETIFVTDPMLIPLVTQHLNVSESKVRAICFGVPVDSTEVSYAETMEFKGTLDWIRRKREDAPNILIGLWIGTFAEKTKAGLEHMFQFTEKTKCGKRPFAMVAIGPIAEPLARSDPELWRRLRASDNIRVVARHLVIPSTAWSMIADFVWKPLNDLSVSLTMYHAAQAKLPIICLRGTFLSELVDKYNLGFSVNVSDNDFTELEYDIRLWNAQNAVEFLKTHNWDFGARALFSSISDIG